MTARRSWPQRGVLVVNVVAIVAALATALVLDLGRSRAERLNRVQLSGSLSEIDDDAGQGRVLNILLVGSDSSSGLDPDDPVNLGRQGEQNSDVMIIAHLDERDGTAALLSLPRDLWVEIASTGGSDRLNSTFALGGPAELIESIELNFGIPIHSYVNVDFAGFQGVVDAVGEVEVYFPEPARDWNAEFNRSQTGFEQLSPGCVALGPEEALAYVRSRYYQTQQLDGTWVDDPGGDLGRIARQQDFLKRMLSRAIELGARNPFVLNDLIDVGLDSVVVDQALTPQFLLDTAQVYSDFEPDDLQTYSYPTRFGSVGSKAVLFGLDEQAAPLLELFAGASIEDPDTVLVRVVADTASEDEAEDLVDALEDEGFDPVEIQFAAAEPGLQLRHGPDGAQAAELVRAALAAPASSLVEVDGLAGREVIVAVGADGATATTPPAETLTPTTAEQTTTTEAPAYQPAAPC